MKPNCKQRFVLFLCILLLGEEFARAKSIIDQLDTHKVSSGHDFEGGLDGGFQNADHDNPDDYSTGEKKASKSHSKKLHLVPQQPADECGGKKSWITTAFKVFKISSDVASYTSLVVTFGTNVYMAARKCKDKEVIEKYTNLYKAEYQKAKDLSDEVDNLQLKSEQDQNYVCSTTELFGKILNKLNEVDKDSGYMLQTISSEVVLASMNASRSIEKLIGEKNETMSLGYFDVDKIYRGALQNALGIAIPAVLLALPAGSALFKIARKRYKQHKMGDLEDTHKIKLKLPSKLANLKRYVTAKFGRWVGKVQGKVGKFLAAFKNKFNRFFNKFGGIARKFKTGLGSALTMAVAVFGAYETIKGAIDECNNLRKMTEDAYNKAKEVVKTISDQLDYIKEHRKAMAEAWGYMRGNLTDEMFLQSLNETKITMEKAANQSEPMKAVASDIRYFMDHIKETDDHNITYDLSKRLYNALMKVPFAYVCYTNKIQIINNVVGYCKDGGSRSLKELIEFERKQVDKTYASSSSSPKRCKDDMGIDYLPDENIKQSWLGTAQEKGYHPICYMNSKQTREHICDKKVTYGWDAKRIASHYTLDKDDVQAVIDLIPPHARGLKMWVQDLICTRKAAGETTDAILMLLKKARSPTTKQIIEEVICDEDDVEKALFIDFKKAVREAWEEKKIEMPKMPTEEEEEEE